MEEKKTEKDRESKKKEDIETTLNNKMEEKKTEKPAEPVKKEEKVEEVGKGKKKGEKKTERPKKTKATAYGKDLSISTKQAVAICDFIRGKRIDEAMLYLEQVVKKKKAVPMKGEIPHRKGENKIMSGRYPINASKIVIKLLRSLAANVSVNGLDIDTTKITTAIANQASRPLRRFGVTRFRRSHVFLEAKEIKEKSKEPRK